MSDLHTHKVMQEGGAETGGRTFLSPTRAFVWAFMAFLVLWAIYIIFFPVVAGDGREPVKTLSYLKQLALTNLMYAADFDEVLPPAESWMDVTLLYSKAEVIYHDPEIVDRKDDEFGFAFFEPLSSVDIERVRNEVEVPLVFQSVLMGRNARSDLSTLPKKPRNSEGNGVAFLDGHVKRMPKGWPKHPVTVRIAPPLAPMSSQALDHFDGSETIESLVAEWNDTSREMALADVKRHNLIPLRLLHMGEAGQRALLRLEGSGIASSNEELKHQKQQANAQLGGTDPVASAGR